MLWGGGKGNREHGLSKYRGKENNNIDNNIGGIIELSRDEFLTIFDTCNSFLCNIDLEKSQIVCDNVTLLAKEPIKSSIWKPRGLHHVNLLIDGLCKHRCLFKDYDPTFEVKDDDYILANEILDRMVKAWDTNLGKKERGFGQ